MKLFQRLKPLLLLCLLGAAPSEALKLKWTTEPLNTAKGVVAASIFGAHNSSSSLHSRNATVSFANASSKQAPDLTAGTLVYDFGFFDGRDSLSYLQAGLKVVAVEADPTLVQQAQANGNIAPYMGSGQLMLLNAAIAPSGTQQWTKFYQSHCTKEWNSFYSSIGCRSCQPPHPEDPSACTVVNVQAASCAAILQQYGMPSYFKLDIEGAEPGCYEALKQYPVEQRPMFISGEVGQPDIVDVYAQLGYTSFKLVRQQSGITGAWGNAAQDCRAGGQWRSYEGAKQDLVAMFNKAPVAGDVCPGSQVGGVWYDMHAARAAPQAW